MDWIGTSGLDWSVSGKMDPCPTLPQTETFSRPSI